VTPAEIERLQKERVDLLEALLTKQAEIEHLLATNANLQTAFDEANEEIQRYGAEIERLRREVEDWKAMDSATKGMSEELKRSLFAEIESLRKKAGQRGARMQIMQEWIEQAPSPTDLSLWGHFLDDHPEAADWFDDDGVPK
jgi:predicted RNase H-like nuclease (RuvC/YqgF family)